MKKYEFTGKEKDGLRRIRRLSDGLLGGWIESEKNLSHEGECFVYDNVYVYGDARIYGDARVSRNAQVFDDAKVFGSAHVSENAMVSGNAQVSGDAQVYGDTWISGDTIILRGKFQKATKHMGIFGLNSRLGKILFKDKMYD